MLETRCHLNDTLNIIQRERVGGLTVKVQDYIHPGMDHESVGPVPNST